jgi:hypothetical protein
MNLTKSILSIITLAAAAIPAAAQTAIDNLAASIENNDNVCTVFSERRNPETKKIYRESRVITVNRDNSSLGAYIAKARKAFEDERPNSTCATYSDGTYTLEFRDSKARYSYVLVIGEKNRSMVLTITKKIYDNFPAKVVYRTGKNAGSKTGKKGKDGKNGDSGDHTDNGSANEHYDLTDLLDMASDFLD